MSLIRLLRSKRKGKANRRDNKAAKNRKRKERRKIRDKKRFFNVIESRKQYIKNLSNEQLTDKQITLLKLELASIEFDKPKDNISMGERQDLKELSRDKSIILKKSDKGKHHRIDEQTGQTNEGQILLDDLNNYRPLDKPMVETTTKKAQQLIKTLLSEGHIDKTTAK